MSDTEWKTQLDVVTDLMRNLSSQTEPHEAARLYGEGLRKLQLIPNDRYVSISRRGLVKPAYRITRCSTWKEHPDPWKEVEKLPLLYGGLLGEILYSNQPAIIEDLPARLEATDPAYEYLSDMQLLAASPHFDHGEALNVGVLLVKDAATFPLERFPMIVFQANLWGRATLNLVTQRKLQHALDSIDRELQVVANIQRSLLPRQLPQIQNAQVAAHYQTSQRAGGDYYDFFPLPDGCWGVFVADVSGHGTPAAVLMAITHAIAHTRPGYHMPPEDVLTFINCKLSQTYTQGTGNFVTALYGVYDPGKREFTFTSAGHPLPRVVRNGRHICNMANPSLPLGILPEEPYHSQTIKLAPLDRILLYTDGITDTFNPAGDAYGTASLDAVACEPPPGTPAHELVRTILESLDQFAAGTPPHDDRTMVIMTIT